MTPKGGHHNHASGSANGRWNGGATAHPLYLIYHDMVSRCTRPNHPRYDAYGGRGIRVCDRWRASFWNFVEDMGERPEGRSSSGSRPLYSLDRRDNDGNYTPENCHWAHLSEQAKNKRGFGPARRDPVTGQYQRGTA